VGFVKETDWTCGCGAFQARLDLRGVGRVICYCRFCQAFAHHLAASDQLDEAGESDLLQMVPEQVRFIAGGENIRCLRLSDKGPIRWYAGCCDTPLGNTYARRSLPFLTITVAGMADRDQLLPVQVRVYSAGARGPIENNRQHWAGFIAAFVRRTIGSWLTGRYRQTPFFDQRCAPVSRVERLTPAQKSAAFPMPKGS
jgi:hypothetical protein